MYYRVVHKIVVLLHLNIIDPQWKYLPYLNSKGTKHCKCIYTYKDTVFWDTLYNKVILNYLRFRDIWNQLFYPHWKPFSKSWKATALRRRIFSLKLHLSVWDMLQTTNFKKNTLKKQLKDNTSKVKKYQILSAQLWKGISCLLIIF